MPTQYVTRDSPFPDRADYCSTRCCSTAKQSTCCEPSEKSSCCGSEATSSGGLWGVLAIGVGFFVGGWFVGSRLGVAPSLHGVAMGIVSILVWFVANLLAGETVADSAWVGGSEAYYAGLLLLQIVAAALGASVSSRSQRSATAGS